MNNLKPAKSSQVDEICHLVNLAYRGELGWTKETALVRGNRCSTDEVLA